MKKYHQLYFTILGCRRETVCLVENKIMRVENTKNKKKKNKINFFEQTKSMFQIVEKGLRVFRMI